MAFLLPVIFEYSVGASAGYVAAAGVASTGTTMSVAATASAGWAAGAAAASGSVATATGASGTAIGFGVPVYGALGGATGALVQGLSLAAVPPIGVGSAQMQPVVTSVNHGANVVYTKSISMSTTKAAVLSKGFFLGMGAKAMLVCGACAAL